MSLAGAPSDLQREGRFRKIRVESDRPRIKLDYRKGYYEEQDFSRMSDSEKRLALHRALEFDTPYAELPLTAGFEFFRGVRGGPSVAYSVGIHPSELPTEKGKKGTKLAFTVAARAVRTDGEVRYGLFLGPRGQSHVYVLQNEAGELVRTTSGQQWKDTGFEPGVDLLADPQ